MTTTREDLLALALGAFLLVQGLGTLATLPRRLTYYGPGVAVLTAIGAVCLLAFGAGIGALLVRTVPRDRLAGLPTG